MIDSEIFFIKFCQSLELDLHFCCCEFTNEGQLPQQSLVAIGPLAVSVNATLPTFQNYKSGVYNDPQCVGDTNHAMLLTGFGTDPRDGDYWILRNSYGKGYGENGYIRMTRNISNMCGIFSYVMFPIYSYT